MKDERLRNVMLRGVICSNLSGAKLATWIDLPQRNKECPTLITNAKSA